MSATSAASRRGDSRRGPGVVARLFHLDENGLRALPGDQVDLARGRPPAPRQNLAAAPLVAPFDAVFGGQARMKGRNAAHPAVHHVVSFRASAIW
jgi:hypothetical protein